MDKLKLKPITNYQLEYHRKRSAKYIFIHDKEGNGTCQYCNSDIVLNGTKHKGTAECHSCGKKLNVHHDWRSKFKPEIIKFMVVPKVLDNHTLVLRFVLAYSGTECVWRSNNGWNFHREKVNDIELNTKEVARMYIDENYASPEYYTLVDNEWVKGKGQYFRWDSYMFPNRFDCHYAYEYPRNFFKEINKLDCFKYYPVEDHYDWNSFSTQLHYLIRSAKLNERLEKAGLENLADEHHSYYISHADRCYPMNHKANDLISMLKLDRLRYQILKQYPTYSMLYFLQNEKQLNLSNFKAVKYNTNEYQKITTLVNKIHVSFGKVMRYIADKNYWEYDHYLSNLNYLGYDLTDTYYSMPKDFRKADDKITKEYEDKLERERLERERIAKMADNEKSAQIKKICDGLRKMPNLQEFLQGSKGLMVYVPESADDLRKEGKELHNCIGTYVERVAAGSTFVFYVRQLNNPTAPFVAFEYAHGEVLQCRLDHNVSVTDTNIISFVDEFANRLRENKFLVA